MPTEQLRHALQALAAPAESQFARFPAFAVAADELALDFDDALRFLAGRERERELPRTAAQAAALRVLEARLEARSDRRDSALWTPAALRTNAAWAEVRALAAAALGAFGWPAALPPPPDPRTFVPGGLPRGANG